MRPYQLEGVNWLLYCYYSKRNCILADEMGLGKTIQAVVTLNHLKTVLHIQGPFLIVAPLATLQNWKHEIETWTDMYCVIYSGDSYSRDVVRKYEFRYKDKKGRNINDIYKFHVLITNYETAITDQTIQRIHWKYLIVDEAHRLKNRNSKLHSTLRGYKFDFALLLTGTPLQNEMLELWNLLNFIAPEKFPESNTFLEKYGELKEKEQVETLQKILKNYILRRVKENVEKDIPKKEETLVEIELTSYQKQYYRAIIERNRDYLLRGSKHKRYVNLINIFMEIRKCCNHPFLIEGAEELLVKENNIKTEQEYTNYFSNLNFIES